MNVTTHLDNNKGGPTNPPEPVTGQSVCRTHSWLKQHNSGHSCYPMPLTSVTTVLIWQIEIQASLDHGKGDSTSACDLGFAAAMAPSHSHNPIFTNSFHETQVSTRPSQP